MNRKLFILTGLLCLIGREIYAQAPVAAFTSNVTQGCAPLAVAFKDQSTNSPTSWEWDLGNGSTSSYQNPSTTYTSPGTYTVTLIVKNASGANAVRMTNYITVYPSPTVSFGSNLNLACVPGNIQFIDYSTPGQGTISSYVWDFGDQSPGSNQAAPAHTYTQTGYYNVSLTVTNSAGCSNSATYDRDIRVVQGIQPQFTWDLVSTSCTAPYLLNFTNQTAGPGTLTYNWNLGSAATPGTSTATNPADVSYATAGNYSVTLSVNSSLGCTGTITQTVPITAGTVAIKGPATGCLNTPVTFSNASTPAPSSSSWDFGDGSANATGNTAIHTYTAAGTYTVTLNSTSPTCSNTTTSTITVGSTFSPVFTANPTTGCKVPLAVQFTDQTTPPLTAWAWSFGDGGTSTQQNPSHNYTTAGSYTVKLTGTNASGCTGIDSMVNVVQITAPTIAMGNLSGCIGSSITPTATINSIDGVASYSWSSTGASSSTGTNTATPAFTYSSPGTYTISLTITTTGGCSTTATSTVQIGSPVTPTAVATPNPICGNKPVTFSASPVSNVYNYTWSFGDGQSDTGNNITHIYKKTGPFTVTVGLNNQGCITNSPPITVNVTPPLPNFGYTVTCGTFSVNFDASDSSYYDASATFTWNFGDPAGGTSSAINPSYTYSTYGNYSVMLIIADDGCLDTITKTVTIDQFIPSFTVTPNPACINTNFTLQSTSQTFPTGTPTSGYAWQIGTNLYHKSGTFVTGLTTVGTYQITLTLTDPNGCTYTSPPTTLVVTGPAAHFTAPATGCIDQAVTFTDNSTPYPGPPVDPITSWNFSYGDGTQGSFTAPPYTHQYADTGTFTPSMEVVDNQGCASAVLGTPVHITKPQAIFFGPDSFYCPGSPLTFIDSSKGYGPLTDTWNFGDGSTTTTNPHSFPPGDSTYKVTLIVTDVNGCTDTTTDPVRIQAPIAAFQIADTTAICAPLQTLFTAQPQYYDSLYWEFGDGTSSTLAVTSHFYNSYDTFYAKLFVQGPGGCLDSATRRVFVSNPYTSTTFTFSPIQACDSVVAQFTVIPPGYTTYTLTFGDGQTDNSDDSSFTHTYRNPNTYQPLIAITDATGCIVQFAGNGGTGEVTVLGSVPFFSVNQLAFCDSGTVLFTDYTITNDPIVSKTYSFGDGVLASQSPPLTNPFDTSHYYNTPGNLLATLNVSTQHGCNETYTDTIRVWQTPHPLISTTGYLCAGLIQLLGNLVTPDVDSVAWAWNLGNGQSSALQDPQVNYQGGTYQVSLITSVAFGCSDTASASITINPLPTIKGPAEISTPVGIPVTIPFTYSSDVTTYVWTPTNNLSCSDCANPSATLQFNQQYTVIVTDSNNCMDTATILIKTVCNDDNYFIPNTFSPNNDGVNDYFYPRGRSIYNIQSMRVFNRWGQMVFQRQNFPANSETMGWDGTFNGKPAPSDAYVYIVEVICNNAQVIALQGTITLVR